MKQSLASEAYARLRTPADRQEYYRTNGYVVVPGLIEPRHCQEALRAFRGEVKPHRGFIYRQASANPERHIFDASRFMLNSILNPIALFEQQFPEFVRCTQDVLTQPALMQRVQELVGEPATMVQSMYFEGNPVTWAHQDTYYLDGELSGSMVAAWIALEDIEEGAGRFYVGIKSHLIDMVKNGGDFNIASHHDRYKALVQDVIARHHVELRSPALAQGDVLFWSSKTIHGAHPPSQLGVSRNSYTAHFIPSSARFLQLQSMLKTLHPTTVRGVSVYVPKDQNRLRNRMIFAIECALPRTFRRLKKLALQKKLN